MVIIWTEATSEYKCPLPVWDKSQEWAEINATGADAKDIGAKSALNIQIILRKLEN